ncbi:hypothetical protein BGZ59_010025 [Podila verticillata]|nr:hypothetical protein BGZ59_010025 [Podila verticillata]
MPASAQVSSVHHKSDTVNSSGHRSVHKHGQDRKDDRPHTKKQHVKKCPKSPPPKSPKPRLHSFRSSIDRHKGKIYIGHEDWYSAYRRNRGPNGGLRKLVLDSNRRKKASITFPPVPSGSEGQNTTGSSAHSINLSNDATGDSASTVHRKARVPGGSTSSSLSGSDSESKSVTSSKDGDKDGDDHSKEEQQGSIQGVRKHKVVSMPVPVNIRPAGLIPKSRSGGHRPQLPMGPGTSRVSLIWHGVWMVSVGLVVDGFVR